jgi:PilZ domain
MTDNRRSEPRNLCASLAIVRWRSAIGEDRNAEANVLDVSTRGLGVQADEWIEPGTRITVQWQSHSFTGMVRHTYESEIGPVVGIEFDEQCRWSEFILTPEHLIRPDDQ